MRLLRVGAAKVLLFGNNLLTFGTPLGTLCTEAGDPICIQAGDFLITE